MTTNTALWSPSQKQMDTANMTRFIAAVNQRFQHTFEDYPTLYQWSIDEKECFWSMLWDFFNVIGEQGERILLHGESIEKALWFPDATLNFAENLLRKKEDEIAIYFRAEDQVEYSLTYAVLYQQVASLAQWLKAQGLQPGQRVAGYLPNLPEAVTVMLAVTSLGGVWTATSPDFGSDSVIERFGQTEPRFLFTVDGYFYHGKRFDIRQKITSIRAQLPSLKKVVQINFAGFEPSVDVESWTDIVAKPVHHIDFVPRKFNDPLYILYSSGTTGKPKCITHKVGATLLQHLKEHQLHSDIRAGDRVFYFTTCGWMMWNWLVTALASEATLVLYDGSPFYPDTGVLWQYAEDVGLTLFGTSAKYIEACKKKDLNPAKQFDLSKLRTLCSTGSVLSPESFDYAYDRIKQDMCLSSVSGGTDIVSCFVLGCPILPVYSGEIQCRGLGMAVAVFDDDGRSLKNQKGELVCTQTFPSQPVYFWADETGEKYHQAYFSRFENVWHHGDYVMLTEHDGIVIFGRSDTTLNPGGVRIGSAEIYRHVDQIKAVIESLVITQDWNSDARIILFVVLKPGKVLDQTLKAHICQTLREQCTPRHVPDKIIQVAEIPRTKSGKIVELAVREIVHNRPVTNAHSLINPAALALYRDLPELQVD